MIRTYGIALCCVLLFGGWLLLPAVAQDDARLAVELGPGKVVPLSEILAAANRLVDGKVIEVELELDVAFDGDTRDNRWVYEVEMLTDDGRIVELEFDARDGQLLEVEGAAWPGDVPRNPG